MSNHESDQSSQETPRSPVTAGAILIGIFIALSLAVGGLVHIAELIRAADVMEHAIVEAAERVVHRTRVGPPAPPLQHARRVVHDGLDNARKHPGEHARPPAACTQLQLVR